MKAPSKLIFILLLLVVSFRVLAQENNEPSADDEEFNLFLFSLLSVFACAMIGAAFIGAAAATLMVLFLFALIAFGIISASVGIGLYRKSFSAGFKSFFTILFGVGGLVIGTAGALLADYLFALELTNQTAAITGALAGLCGGILVAIATFRIFQILIRKLSQKLQLV